MKIYLSASAFVLGILFLGIGHATAVSVDSSRDYVMGSPGIVEVTEAAHERDMFMLRDDNGEYEQEVREKEERRRIDRDGDGIVDFCANFPGPDFCKEGTRIVVAGVNNNTGCSIYSCKEVGDNELRELEQKLEETYKRISQLKQDAEKLQKLIADKKGNKTMPPRPIFPPDKKICTTEYAPVCGQIDTGIRCITTPCPSTKQKTFSNSCDAERNHAKILYKGQCKQSPPRTDPDPRNDIICTREYAPVCAAVSEPCGTGDMICSGGAQRTYSNRCEAKAHNAEFLYNGACNMGTEATRVDNERKRIISPIQRLREIPDTATIPRDERPLPVLRKRMSLVTAPSLMDAPFEKDVAEQVQAKKTPVIQSGRWDSIINFLRRR